MKSGIDNPIQQFEIVFNYSFVIRPDQRGEDIFIILELNRGIYKLMSWRNV